MKGLLIFILMFPFIGARAQGLDPYKLDFSSDQETAEDKEIQNKKTELSKKKKIEKKEEDVDDEELSEDNEQDQEDSLLGAEQKTPRGFINTGYMFFPIYERVDSSTTALGVDFAYYFRRYGENPKSSPNYLRTLFVAGQNQYVDTQLSFNNYWDDEKHNIYASISYQRRWANYYQISSDNPQLLGSYRASDVNFNVLYRQRMFDDTYLGGKYEYEGDSMTARSPSSVFSETVFAGLTGGSVSGVGVIFGNMPNDDIFAPRANFAYEITNMVYLKAFGSKTNFGKHTFDLRKYLQLFKFHTIAFQFYMNFLSGNPTYRQLSSLGDIFRAYYQDKFLDYHMMALRGEYRWILFDRFALTAFLGAGYHSNAISKFRLNNYLPSYGAGFRYLLNTDLNAYARLDYFEGRGSRGFMFGIGNEL
jgi:hypothetical protein